ncbi:hypothetical protein LY632_09690 [Erythrobacter sp. SDW2]|uniref:hypothetical protein n=1 Tax=Erythrobacter sp. SDW2 TaxID=2907154 RepID=UPI001F3A8CB2|nr:hypothetical protein [Erythrobacter sp. SDW2]UIP05972.1 hypothetical protein LY632_09690 [Erythrobacter sp. SDW2]
MIASILALAILAQHKIDVEPAPPPRPVATAPVPMVVGADGTVTDCTETSEGGLGEMGIFKGLCEDEARKVCRLGFQDGDGKPVAKRFSMTFAVDVEDVAVEAEDSVSALQSPKGE